MFGYILPARGELRVRELEAYQAAYCGLCHALGRRCGFFSRFVLNYDFTLLAMLLDPGQEPPDLGRKRCIACPLRGKTVCRSGDHFDLAADESVILTYWKLRDNVSDMPFWRGLPARFLSRCLGRAYRQAARRCPDFDCSVVQCLEELHALEAASSPSLDRTADTCARILQAAAPVTGAVERDRALEQLLYHVGRWIYLVDAWDDREEDRTKRSYNPLSARYPDGPEAHAEEIRTTLKHSLNLAISAQNLTDPGPWNGIILNILCIGMPMVEEAVFSGAWRQMRKASRRQKHERSL